MRRRVPAICLALLLTVPCGAQETTFDDKAVALFASMGRAQEILGARDEFIKQLEPLDRAARMGVGGDVSEEEFLRFVRESALAWTDVEKASVRAAIDEIRPTLSEFALGLPDQIFLVKTTGREEQGSAYTRGNAIVIPLPLLRRGPSLARLLAHELFHVFTRHRPEVRKDLYAVIGFTECNDLELPDDLGHDKTTNPDAFRHDFFIRVSCGGTTTPAVLIPFAGHGPYATLGGESIRQRPRMKLLAVEKTTGGNQYRPQRREGRPVLYDVEEASGFYEQVGRNTDYITHPEEILAENFSCLATGRKRLPSPRVLLKLQRALYDLPRRKASFPLPRTLEESAAGDQRP